MEIDLLDGIGWRVCINVTDQTRFLVATDAHGLHCSTTAWAVYNVINDGSILAVSNLIKCYLEYWGSAAAYLLTLFSKYSIFIPLFETCQAQIFYWYLGLVGISHAWCIMNTYLYSDIEWIQYYGKLYGEWKDSILEIHWRFKKCTKFE